MSRSQISLLPSEGPRSAQTVPDTPPSSLNTIVTNYIDRSPERRWVNMLLPAALPRELKPDSSENLAMVRFNVPVTRENQPMAVKKVARALTPAFLLHGEAFTGDAALIRVICEEGVQSLAIDRMRFPDAILGVNLEQLKGEIASKYAELGEKHTHTTLYAVQLGAELYKGAFVRGSLGSEGWEGYRAWRNDLKARFGVNIRLVFDHGTVAGAISPPANLPQHSCSSMLHEQASHKNNGTVQKTPRLTKSESQMIKGALNFAKDWRRISFFSVDGRNTVDPEDIVSISNPSKNGMHIKYLVPLHAARAGTFRQGKTALGIGVEAYLTKDGTFGYNHGVTAVVRNSAVLYSDDVSKVIERLQVNEGRIKSGKPKLDDSINAGVRAIEEDGILLQQLSALTDAAVSHMARRLRDGSLIKMNLQSESEVLNQKSYRAEAAVFEMTKFAQRAFAEWILNRKNPPPVIVLRPNFNFGSELDEIKKILPWVTTEAMANPDRRRMVASVLASTGHRELLSRFAQSFPIAANGTQFAVVSSACELEPQDVCRFKRAHRAAIGAVNQIQALSVLLPGAPSFSADELRFCVKGLSLNDSDLKLRFGAMLSDRISDTNKFLRDVGASTSFPA
ncbi:MAG: hypothetical protein J5J00_06285 [Deltaproteobacteria bacterium]|nr:hypothetical protein [Deltaproteobacteria bacterium]